MALIDDILEVLKDPEYNFRVGQVFKEIRGRHISLSDDICPITALFHKRNDAGRWVPNSHYKYAGWLMGYGEEETEAVADAADYDILDELQHNVAFNYRTRMLEAIEARDSKSQ